MAGVIHITAYIWELERIARTKIQGAFIWQASTNLVKIL